ncbi:MAG: tetratricopeptide repeat protein [Lachnospiraceae bacterium]|jgi:TolA-binding protein
MKCYKCGNFLYENDYCADCGADVATYKRIVKKSNELYNRGLAFAKDRNLSGAIDCLTISIKMYKGNINAHNLLGLIYAEVGEYTLALAQWIISKSYQDESNLADNFLNELQNSRQDLNLMTVSIRKYNKAISYVQQGNFDLAEIQLKKLLVDNTNMVKAYQLLALLLAKKKRFEEARTALRSAEKVDRGSPITISYMTYVEREIEAREMELTPTELRSKRVAEREAEGKAPLSGDDVIIPKPSYSEYNRTTMAAIQIIIGIIIGAAVVFFIILPAKTKSLRNEYAAQIADLSLKMEQMEANEPESGRNEPEVKIDKNHSDLITAQIAYYNDEDELAYEMLGKIDTATFTEEQKEYFEHLKGEVENTVSQKLLEDGLRLYAEENYVESTLKLEAAYNMNVRTADLLYYLGRSHDFLSDKNNTLKFLRQFVAEYPDNENVEIANQIINSWNR